MQVQGGNKYLIRMLKMACFISQVSKFLCIFCIFRPHSKSILTYKEFMDRLDSTLLLYLSLLRNLQTNLDRKNIMLYSSETLYSKGLC